MQIPVELPPPRFSPEGARWQTVTVVSLNPLWMLKGDELNPCRHPPPNKWEVVNEANNLLRKGFYINLYISSVRCSKCTLAWIMYWFSFGGNFGTYSWMLFVHAFRFKIKKNIRKTYKNYFLLPLTNHFFGSCGVPPCPFDLRLHLNTFSTTGIYIYMFI